MEAKGSTVGHRGGRYLKILAFAWDDRAGAQPAWARFALPMLRFRVPPIQNEKAAREILISLAAFFAAFASFAVKSPTLPARITDNG